MIKRINNSSHRILELFSMKYSSTLHVIIHKILALRIWWIIVFSIRCQLRKLIGHKSDIERKPLSGTEKWTANIKSFFIPSLLDEKQENRTRPPTTGWKWSRSQEWSDSESCNRLAFVHVQLYQLRHQKTKRTVMVWRKIQHYNHFILLHSFPGQSLSTDHTESCLVLHLQTGWSSRLMNERWKTPSVRRFQFVCAKSNLQLWEYDGQIERNLKVFSFSPCLQ